MPEMHNPNTGVSTSPAGTNPVPLAKAEPVRPATLRQAWWERVRAGKIGLFLASLYLFMLAITLMKAGLEVIVEVLEGPPADAMLRVADVRQCDLIVMGSRGHGTLASLLLGGMSHRVLAHAQAPVMIVSATANDAR